MVIAWRSVVDGCVLICLLCRVFFKVCANRRVGKSKDPKNRVPEIAVPDLVLEVLLITEASLLLLFDVCAARAVYFHDVSPRKSLGWSVAAA